MIVTILSSPMVTQALGANEVAADATSGLEPKATATPNAPVATINERRESAWLCRSLCMALSLGDALNGGDDAGVGTASADVAVHVPDDLLACRLGIVSQQIRGLHDLAGLAVAALRHLHRHPGFLQRMAGIRRQAFDGRHLFVGDLA